MSFQFRRGRAAVCAAMALALAGCAHGRSARRRGRRLFAQAIEQQRIALSLVPEQNGFERWTYTRDLDRYERDA